MSSIHHLLWTGGWDSTFRLADLAIKHGRVVQPHYVLDQHRRSTRPGDLPGRAAHEVPAIRKIQAAISAKWPDAGERILPLAIHRTVEPDDAVVSAFRRVQAETGLGSQQEWLPRFAAHSGIAGLELAVHQDDLVVSILAGQVVRSELPPPDDVFRLIDDPDNDDYRRLFRHYLFPLLTFTKLEMERYANEHGFAEILELTTFCHKPTRHGQPCGACNPCRHTRDEGLGRRVPSGPMVSVRRAWRLTGGRAVRRVQELSLRPVRQQGEAEGRWSPDV